MRDVVEWLVEKRLIRIDEVVLANEVLEDMINIHVATGGDGDIRKEIIGKARTSSHPNKACLRGIRKAVYRAVNRLRYADYRQRLYRQAKLSVKDLEHKRASVLDQE